MHLLDLSYLTPSNANAFEDAVIDPSFESIINCTHTNCSFESLRFDLEDTCHEVDIDYQGAVFVEQHLNLLWCDILAH
jgi:hypothetical protein